MDDTTMLAPGARPLIGYRGGVDGGSAGTRMESTDDALPQQARRRFDARWGPGSVVTFAPPTVEQQGPASTSRPDNLPP